MKYLVDNVELSSLDKIKGKTLINRNDSIGSIVVADVDIENMRILSFRNNKKYILSPKFFANFEIIEEETEAYIEESDIDGGIPQMIFPKFDEDIKIVAEEMEYQYNRMLNLSFLDYYVPFSHKTRRQVSSIIDRDINQFSEYINNYRSNNGFHYLLSNNLFKQAWKEILELLKSGCVILVDLLGLLSNQKIEQGGLIYIDVKNISTGHLIEKHTKESVKKKSTKEAKRILLEKYKLNVDVSNSTQKDIKHCYIFDDVYTKGNTVNRIKELINQHMENHSPTYHIYTYAKTVRYKTNYLRYEHLLNNNKKNVLFVCNKNMTRSILAEAIARNEFKQLNTKYNFYSCGILDWAGREICDDIYEYIVTHNLYDKKLIPQKLTTKYETSYGRYRGSTIIDTTWTVIVLENDIVQLVKDRYELDDSNLVVRNMLDICNYDNHSLKHYEDVEYLANQIRDLIREVFLNEKEGRSSKNIGLDGVF